MVWKFCVVEQNVQCWKKQKGLLIKEENSTHKNHQMANRILGQKIKCCSQEVRNADFICFMGHSTSKVKSLTSEHTSTLHTNRHDLSGRGS